MTVSLVGAGCGTPRLLTYAAAERLATAEHVVYDRLIHPDLLQLAPQGCVFHLAGKRERNHTLAQDEINALLAELGAGGANVVRLKGGDPFVFGRGGEEAQYLEERGIPWEAVPGITSALGGALCAGLPVTHRDLASSVTLATGHRRGDADGADDDRFWREVAAADGTVALYMGVSAFADVAARLMAHGKSPETPVSLVSWGGWGRSRRLDGALAEIAARAGDGSLPSPAIIYIGGAAPCALHPVRGPLAGMQIAICRPYPECWDTGRALEELGADCYGLPLLSLEPLLPERREEVQYKLRTADWIVLTSPRGAGELRRVMPDIRGIRGKVAVIGEGTARALRAVGIVPDRVADGDSDALAEMLGEQVRAGEHVVFARNERGSHVAVEAVRRKGAEPVSISTYRMVPNAVPGLDVMREQWRMCGLDAVAFGSAALAEAYADALGAPPESAALLAWGKVCAETVEKLFGRPAKRLPTPDLDGLTKALQQLK